MQALRKLLWNGLKLGSSFRQHFKIRFVPVETKLQQFKLSRTLKPMPQKSKSLSFPFNVKSLRLSLLHDCHCFFSWFLTTAAGVFGAAP